MEKFIPYEKLSKKAKRELDQKKRKSWNGINPVTRKPQNPKAYNRRKAQKYDDSYSVPFILSFITRTFSNDCFVLVVCLVEFILNFIAPYNYFLRKFYIVSICRN